MRGPVEMRVGGGTGVMGHGGDVVGGLPRWVVGGCCGGLLRGWVGGWVLWWATEVGGWVGAVVGCRGGWVGPVVRTYPVADPDSEEGCRDDAQPRLSTLAGMHTAVPGVMPDEGQLEQQGSGVRVAGGVR